MNYYRLIAVFIILILILFSFNLDKGGRDISIKTEPEVLGFYVNWSQNDLSSYNSLKKNSSSIDMVSPYWYTINSDGALINVYQIEQEETVSFCRNENIEILPLFNNKNTSYNILVDEQARERAINNIFNTVVNKNYAGALIDFEYIPGRVDNELTNFIKELSQRLNKRGKLLHIAVFPKVNFPDRLNLVYDYEELPDYVDRITIMTYDKHRKSTAPGPIAPINWVEDNIKYALQYMPSHKLHLGIANYGYDWTQPGEASSLGSRQIYDLARREGKEVLWDEEFKSPYFQYRDRKNNLHEVWFENSKSLKYKLDLVKKYDLGGISIWKLGYETEKFWNVMNTN